MTQPLVPTPVPRGEEWTKVRRRTRKAASPAHREEKGAGDAYQAETGMEGTSKDMRRGFRVLCCSNMQDLDVPSSSTDGAYSPSADDASLPSTNEARGSHPASTITEGQKQR
ncbi:hypothetical protein Dimus_015998 [Dionaea muscipula]